MFLPKWKIQKHVLCEERSLHNHRLHSHSKLKGKKNWEASCRARKRPKVWVNKSGANKWNNSDRNKTHFFTQLVAIWLYQVRLETLPNIFLFLLLFSSRNDSKKKFLCKFRNFIHHHFFSLSSASFLLVSLSWLDEIFTINFHATVARQVGEEIFPHLLSELLRLPSPLASSNLNSTHYATIHGRFFFRAQQWELRTNILITRRHNGWFFTSRRFSSAFFFHIFFAVCCVANDDDYGDGGADGIGKAEKKSMNSLTEMCLSSETVSIKRSFRDFGSN